MGKYVDFDDPHLDIESAEHFVKAFALWLEIVFFDVKNKWLIINISYSNDHFFKEEILSAIKFFMQFHDYSFISSQQTMKPAFDND